MTTFDQLADIASEADLVREVVEMGGGFARLKAKPWRGKYGKLKPGGKRDARR